jgi:hypothetical protein
MGAQGGLLEFGFASTDTYAAAAGGMSPVIENIRVRHAQEFVQLLNEVTGRHLLDDVTKRACR